MTRFLYLKVSLPSVEDLRRNDEITSIKKDFSASANASARNDRFTNYT